MLWLWQMQPLLQTVHSLARVSSPPVCTHVSFQSATRLVIFVATVSRHSATDTAIC